MISGDNIMAYWKQFGTIYNAEPDGGLFVEDEDGTAYKAPEGETDQSFADRMKRSKEARRNLFFEEWEKVNTERSGSPWILR